MLFLVDLVFFFFIYLFFQIFHDPLVVTIVLLFSNITKGVFFHIYYLRRSCNDEYTIATPSSPIANNNSIDNSWCCRSYYKFNKCTNTKCHKREDSIVYFDYQTTTTCLWTKEKSRYREEWWQCAVTSNHERKREYHFDKETNIVDETKFSTFWWS